MNITQESILIEQCVCITAQPPGEVCVYCDKLIK